MAIPLKVRRIRVSAFELVVVGTLHREHHLRATEIDHPRRREQIDVRVEHVGGDFARAQPVGEHPTLGDLGQ